MPVDLLYLRPNVQAEPVFDQWYAWSHLIPPAPAARNVTERHFKIMDSYVHAPQVHANAVKNPRLLGGPFIDLDGKRTDEIGSLKDETRSRRPQLIELSSAISSLDELLRAKAKGFSLADLYEKTPAALKGYVELAYDLNNNPRFRLLEPLLYKSRFYDPSAQGMMLSLTAGDERPFVLSTPRLPSRTVLQLRRPFADQAIDDLFSLKTTPRPWTAIRDALDIPEESEATARSFFTTEPPPTCAPYSGPGVRWRYFGHACVLVEARGVSILFDPLLSYEYDSKTPRYTYKELPESIDYVAITHNHQDHVVFETLLQLRHKVKCVIVPPSGGGELQDPSLKLILRQIGFTNVIELDEMENLAFENAAFKNAAVKGGSITALPFLGEHSDLGIRCKTAYLVRIGDNSLLFAADSCNMEPGLYKHIHDEVGDVDVVFLGMECEGAPLSWLYGPLLTKPIERGMDESRRLNGSNFKQAADLVRRFNSRSAYVYAMGQEPWLGYLMSLKYNEQSRQIIESNLLIEECGRNGVICERLFARKEVVIGA